MYDRSDVQFSEVRVFLADSNVQDWFRSGIAHGYSCPNFIVDCIKFRKQYCVDFTSFFTLTVV